jgi:hypothetical protein
VFGGIAGTGDARRVLSTVEVYDPTADSWFQATPMSAGKSGAAAAVLDDKIYLAGGKLGAGAGAPATERVDVYDPDLDRWALGRPLPTRRVSGCAAVIADRLYVLGGGTAGGLTKPVEVYEVKTDTWRSGAPLAMVRNNHSCAQVGDTVYVVGGTNTSDGSSLLTQAETYRPQPAAQ